VNALTDLGVTSAMANCKTGQVLVEYDADVVSVEDMKNEIKEAGYEVV